QSIDHRAGKISRLGFGDIFGIGGQYRGPRLAQLVRRLFEDTAFHGGRCLRQHGGSRARRAAELEHALAQVVGNSVLRGAHACFVPKSTKSSRWMISSPPL